MSGPILLESGVAELASRLKGQLIDETNIVIQLSQAISAKRQADALEKIADSLTALGVDRVGLASWIENVAFYSGQSFERGRSGR